MVDVPPALIDAIRDQRAVLFLGAGASLEALRPPEVPPVPKGDMLRDWISDKFLGGGSKKRPLTLVSAMAASEAGLTNFQSYIRDIFLPYGPAPFHELIPKFRWRALVSTNFDLILERVYERDPDRRQNLVKTLKDGDHLDTRLNREANPVAFYKLHGCIDYYTDPEIPLILGADHYASYELNRRRLYDRFRDLGFEYPIIFAGYSISDPHIQRILFDLTDPKIGRPPYYIVSPGMEPEEVRYWASHRVIVIDATLADFLTEIDKRIPASARAFPIAMGGGRLSIRTHYRVVDAEEPPSVKAYLQTDAVHVHAGLIAKQQDPVQFYRGNDDGWGSIIQNLDARRTVSDSVLVDAVLIADDAHKPTELFMLKGPAGNGKTVALKRIAWEAATQYDKLVFYVDGPAGLRIDPLAEIHRLTGKRAFIFVDRVALVRSELRELINAARARNVPLTVIGAERDNEWNTYCEQLEPFLSQDFPVRYLSETEIRELIGLLERHNALGLLKDRSPEERLRAFSDVAERQLLVALHVVTLGGAFEDIIVDEFRRIEPDAARSVYLDICALHQFGALVRVGLIHRSTGVEFGQFQKEFLKPLENVVHVVHDRHNKDVYYRSRHQHVAEIVFNRVLPKPEDRFDLLARLLTALNVDYTSDNETFMRLIRGRGIAEIFPSVEIGRLFYDRVHDAVPDNPFVYHQRAVFEMNHAGGSLLHAESAANTAANKNKKGNNASIYNTQAEIARRLANQTDDPLKKRALRRTAREKMAATTRANEYDLNTSARLAIDELRELSAELSVADQTRPPPALVEAAKDAEEAIDRGLQLFPDNSDLLATEASFRELLKEDGPAQQALQRAFSLNPRQDWLAVRLARKFVDGGDVVRAKSVLEACLRDNPSSKSAHMELGRLLVANGDPVAGLEHLKRGYTDGDNNYEAQFWYARELLLNGNGDVSGRMFGSINERAPGRFRSRTSALVERNKTVMVYSGRISRKEEGYAFIHCPQFEADLFASRADSAPEKWDALANGDNVHFKVGFNRRGARATDVERD